jgi:hypothetical protein
MRRRGSSGLVWLRIGTSESSCQCSKEPSGSINCWEVLECLHSRWPLNSKDLHWIFVLLSINVTHSIFIFYYSSTCFCLTRPSSGVIVYSPEAGALLCQCLPMWCCQPRTSADGVLIVSVRLLEYLCCLCGRHVACFLLSVLCYIDGQKNKYSV